MGLQRKWCKHTRPCLRQRLREKTLEMRQKHGHRWITTVAIRNEGSGCPYCSSHRVLAGFNDFASIRPSLVKEWDQAANGDLKPTQVTGCGVDRYLAVFCDRFLADALRRRVVGFGGCVGVTVF
ncbi:protein of unknown function [Agreia sp. COWG]|nr:protein of unknown function [Agreia sp. COWG]